MESSTQDKASTVRPHSVHCGRVVDSPPSVHPIGGMDVDGKSTGGRKTGSTEHSEFCLRLRPLTGRGWTAPATQRLRWALKFLLRRFGFRAVECRPAPEAQGDEQPEETKATE